MADNDGVNKPNPTEGSPVVVMSRITVKVVPPEKGRWRGGEYLVGWDYRNNSEYGHGLTPEAALADLLVSMRELRDSLASREKGLMETQVLLLKELRQVVGP